MGISVGAGLVTTAIGDGLCAFDHEGSTFLSISKKLALFPRRACFNVEIAVFARTFVDRTETTSCWIERPLLTFRTFNPGGLQITKRTFFRHTSPDLTSIAVVVGEQPASGNPQAQWNIAHGRI